MPELSDDKLRELARGVLEAESRAVKATLASLDASFFTVARLLCACRGKVVVVGSGTSGAVAARGAHLLSVGGTPAFHLSPADGLHGGLGVLRQDDIVLALSKNGGSQELNEFCRRARALCGSLVAITVRRGSELVSLVDHAIFMALDDDADLGAVVATGSSLATGAVIDALVEIGRVARGYSWQQLLFTHPAGAVGTNAERSLQRLSGEPGAA